MPGLNPVSGWPTDLLNPADYAQQWPEIKPAFLNLMRQHGLPESEADALAATYLPLATWIHRQFQGGTFVVGINGAQGSGKSTLSEFMRLLLVNAYHHRVAVISIDDLYRTRAERLQLADTVHPLLATRGVPGTHDVDLGLSLLTQLANAGDDTRTPLPSFDKARDDRRPRSEWQVFEGRADIILFEGWCVGSQPEREQCLSEPMNVLERDEDRDGRWRRHVNQQLGGDYARLFARLDALIFLRVPGMEQVLEWRGLQESKLSSANAGENQNHHLMDERALVRFIMHYERLTRHNLAEMPGRADVTLYLDEHHRFRRVVFSPEPTKKLSS